MNNLHRGLAPISDAAWTQMEEEASRTIKRHLAARRVVDVQGPKGVDFSAVGTGHQRQIHAPGNGIEAAQREAKALVELRAPFELTRAAIDDVERGAERFRLVAAQGSRAQDRLRRGSRCLRWVCRRRNSGRPPRRQQPGIDAPFQRKRLSGCGRTSGKPVASGRRQWTLCAAIGNGAVYGHRRRDRRRISGSGTHPASGGRQDHLGASHRRRRRVTTRGGDFELTIGQDLSIGYLSHSETVVRLYFQETLTFQLLTTEAAVVLASEALKSA